MHARQGIVPMFVALVLASGMATGGEIGRVARNVKPETVAVPCGESWETVNPPPTRADLLAVTWAGSQVVAVGSGGAILTSSDGIGWTARDAGTAADLYGLVWTGTQLVAVGVGKVGLSGPFFGVILTSPDGISWTVRIPTTDDLSAVAWTGERLVAVGSQLEIEDQEAATILTSPDGVVWAAPTSAGYPGLSDVIWAGTQLVAVGAFTPMGPGAVLTSPDGAVWTSRDSASSYPLLAVDWTGSRFVAVGASRAITTSDDAIAWTSRNPGVGATLSGIAWSGAQHVAVGESGTILTSPDGVTWQERSSGTPSDLRGVAWTGSQLVAVGNGGTIVRDDCAAACSAPQVTLEPQNVTVAPGGGATLTVTADGTGPLGYQWYMGRAGDTTFPVGTNSSTLSTTPLAGAATYWVRISNACGHVDSDAASISAGWAVRRHVRVS